MRLLPVSYLRSPRWFSTRQSKPFYITTPIFYVNAAPHIGHLYSAVITDCLFRFEKLQTESREYVFSTGTDEHGLKIHQAAEQRGQPVADYCNTIANSYKGLFDKSSIGYTDFIRTTEERHKRAVGHFWNTLKEKDLIYKSTYAGWYCVPDETFLTESQLMGKPGENFKVSIESGHPVEWTEEENYLFKLSKFQDDVIRWVEQGDRIKPKKFEKLLLHYLNEPLPDLSVSRPSARVPWGIPVPDDPSHSIYVWMDALVNYLTVVGYPSPEFSSKWPASLQVIGKDILKFHGIYWPAFLMAAGLEPPQQLLVHSHWTVDDKKMSKSKNNVVDPHEVASKYTYEGLRYFLLRQGVPHSDGNYSDVKALRYLNADLADTLGNLLSRSCAKAVNERQVIPRLNKNELQTLRADDSTKSLIELASGLPDIAFEHYKSGNIYLVIEQVIKTLHAANGFYQIFRPWELRKSPEQLLKLEAVLHLAFETLRICGIIMQPILPEMSGKLLDKMNIEETRRTWEDSKSFLHEDYAQQERRLRSENAILFTRIR